ncbi:MAG: VWA domain-containing protein [Ardenticatenaceae bacterium]|nr:VWA domain-containing protein [Ardenticatenaceae bacterium]
MEPSLADRWSHTVRAVATIASMLMVLVLSACGGRSVAPTASTPVTADHRPAPATQVAQAAAPTAAPTTPFESGKSEPAPPAPGLESRESSTDSTGGAPALMPTTGPSREAPAVGRSDTDEAKSRASAPQPMATAAPAGEAPAAADRSTAESEGSRESGAAPLPTVAGAPPPAHPDRSRQFEPVTAGVVDDNEQWQAYLDYRARHDYLYVNDRDVSERYVVQVWDSAGQPVHDAVVRISAGQQFFFEGRTDASGRLLFHPRAVDPQGRQWQAGRFDVVASKGQARQHATFDRYSQEHWAMTLPGAPVAPRAQLDLLFLIDATGSMADEIDKLKGSMGDIADQIAGLPERPDVRYGLVAYRDRGDQFVVRAYDFTPDLGAFQRTLAALRADGGGDEPESLNEALHRSLNDLHWRHDDTVRLTLLVADAPPHLDYGEPYSYDRDMIAAVRQGIKIFPVGASGLDEQGEYIFRQLAQFTGGKFVFLTYAQAGNPASGPGTETGHDVANYSVDTLDRLVVRLVREELARLPRLAAGQQPQFQVQVQPIIPPTDGTIRLEGLPGMTRLGSDGFKGRWEVEGTTVVVGNEAALTEVRGWKWPERIEIPVGRRDVRRVVLLLSLANGYAGFEGQTVGRLRLEHGEGTVEVPLVAGENIRDWCVSRGHHQVVTDLRDPNALEVWRGPIAGCDEAALSALLIDRPAGFLRSVTVIDESRLLLGDPDPGIAVYGLSVVTH